MTHTEAQKLRDRLKALCAEKEEIELTLARQEEDAAEDESKLAARFRYERLLEICELNDQLEEKIHEYVMDYYEDEISDTIDSIVYDLIAEDIDYYSGEFE